MLCSSMKSNYHNSLLSNQAYASDSVVLKFSITKQRKNSVLNEKGYYAVVQCHVKKPLSYHFTMSDVEKRGGMSIKLKIYDELPWLDPVVTNSVMHQCTQCANKRHYGKDGPWSKRTFSSVIGFFSFFNAPIWKVLFHQGCRRQC